MRVSFELFHGFASPHQEDLVTGPDMPGGHNLEAVWVRACGSDAGIECYH